MQIETAAIISFLSGVALTLIAIYRYAKSRITLEEANSIAESAKEVLAEYEKAKSDGTVTVDEKLIIADKSINVLKLIIKSLQ